MTPAKKPTMMLEHVIVCFQYCEHPVISCRWRGQWVEWQSLLPLPQELLSNQPLELCDGNVRRKRWFFHIFHPVFWADKLKDSNSIQSWHNVLVFLIMLYLATSLQVLYHCFFLSMWSQQVQSENSIDLDHAINSINSFVKDACLQYLHRTDN